MKKLILSLVVISCLISLNLSSQMYIKVNLDNDNVINNTTEYNVGLHLIFLIEMFELDNVSINLVYLPDKYKNTDKYNIRGVVNKVNDETYSIYLLRNMNKLEVIMILCHEFIHIKQYDSKRLIKCGNSMIFDGIEYDKTFKYNQLPYEKEAFKMQKKVYKELQKIIMNKVNNYKIFY